MIKRSINLFSICVLMLLLTGCIGPAKVDRYVEIKPNETAFVIPLEGDTSAQRQVYSIDYLRKHKVTAKRIYLPQKKVSTGRWWWEYKWIPTVRVITVDRSPITFEWSKKTGNPIRVESKDSIDFKVGVTIAAYIDEKNTPMFLYYYPQGALEQVLNHEVYTEATEFLSYQFAKYNLKGVDKCPLTIKGDSTDSTVEVKSIDSYDIGFNSPEFYACGAREMKGIIIKRIKHELQDYFSKKGVTITAFGLVGGMGYDDPKIQQAINENFESELNVINKHNERLAQNEINQKLIDKATADRKAAEEFAKAAEARIKQVELKIQLIKAQAVKTAAERWNGQLPKNVVPESSMFMFDLNKTK